MAPVDLLIFTIGPVQSFIAAARRTQDLYLGSRLLSHLAHIGVEAVWHIADSRVLYPHQRDGVWPRSIPNRFVVETPGGQGAAVAQAITNAVVSAWSDPKEQNGVADQVEQLFADLAGEHGVWRSIWRRQVDSWLETYWVAYPWDSEQYGTVYGHASLALDMRKRLRVYPIAAEPGEKCTLCGMRQALCDTLDPDPRSARRFWRIIASNRIITAAEVRDGERLCAICTIKRFAVKARALPQDNLIIHVDDGFARFPSTSSIASASFRQGLLDHWETIEPAVRAHLAALDALNQPTDRYRIRKRRPEPFPALERRPGADELLRYDGDFFYPETFTPQRLHEILGRVPEEGARLTAQRSLEALKSQARQINRQIGSQSPRQTKIPLPHSYLAILALDGDKVGELLRSCEDDGQHAAISAALATFAERDVPRIVEQEHPGSLVYAGGDDVLALLPVSDALAVADKLRTALSEALAMAGHPDRTASCGIALLHHMQPLESGIRAARGAEERAKEDYDRNALVIDMLRRSGERRSVGTRWEYGDVDEMAPTPIATIDAVRQAILADALSGKIGYEVDLIAPAMTGDPRDSLRYLPAAARQAELRRLFKRHTPPKSNTGQEEANQRLADNVAALAEYMALRQGAETPTDRGALRQMAGWLLLARFLVQGGDR